MIELVKALLFGSDSQKELFIDNCDINLILDSMSESELNDAFQYTDGELFRRICCNPKLSTNNQNRLYDIFDEYDKHYYLTALCYNENLSEALQKKLAKSKFHDVAYAMACRESIYESALKILLKHEDGDVADIASEITNIKNKKCKTLTKKSKKV